MKQSKKIKVNKSIAVAYDQKFEVKRLIIAYLLGTSSPNTRVKNDNSNVITTIEIVLIILIIRLQIQIKPFLLLLRLIGIN